MSDILIRGANEEDLHAILDITRRAWTGMTVAHLREERHGIVGGKPWYEHKCSEIQNSFKRGPQWFLVAEMEGKIIGYASFSYSDENKLGIVGNNAVDPDFRGRGIGTSLISEVVQTLKDKGAELLQVSTLLHDIPAQRIYEKLGFIELARTIHYTMDVR